MNTLIQSNRLLATIGFFAIVLFFTAAVQAQNTNRGPQAGQRPDSLASFQDALKRDNFEIKMGYASVLDLRGLYCGGQLDNALYQNKNAPYLSAYVPELEEESPRTFVGRSFRLRYDEAIVLIGLTPPPEKYFSYQPYLLAKVYPQGSIPVFASLGDTVNLRTIKTLGPTPFNSPVILIFTPDQGTDARIRAALRSSGLPNSIINTLVFPSSMLTLGLGEEADQFLLVSRNAVWENEDAGRAYIENPPVMVFRVTPQEPAVANPFPAPPLRIRGTGQTEMNWMNKLGELREGILATYPDMNATELVTKPMGYEGYDFIQRAVNVLGDTRDALYLAAGFMPDFGIADELTLADDEFLIVYGLNHVATGKATYTNINVYASETAKLGIASIFDNDLLDTAAPYLPPGDPAADLMYVCKIARNCDGGFGCLPLEVEDCPRLDFNSDTLLGVAFRLYLEPPTNLGPTFTEILYDRVIKFSPKG